MGARQEVIYRLLPSLLAALVYGAFTAVWFWQRPHYVPLISLFDATPDRPPFGDLGSILQAGLCWRQGVDVYLPSACMHGGVFNYSPVMLRSILLPFNPGETAWLGLLIAAFFLIAHVFLPPAQGVGALALRCLALCSGMVMYVLECANFDAVVFVMLVMALLLLRSRGVLSLGAYLIFAIAAAFKFYPAILLGLALRERGWRLAVLGAVLAAGGLYFMLHYGAQSQAALATLPAGLPFRGGFSAMNIPFGLALLATLPRLTLSPDKAQYFAAIGTPHFAAFVVLGTRLIVAAAVLAGVALARAVSPALARLDESRRLFLLAGALLIAFCFYAAQNYDYRGIFLLFTLPALQSMAAERGGGIWRAYVIGILLLLWEAPLRQAVGATGSLYMSIAFWLLRDSLWTAVVLGFTAFGFAGLFAAFRLPTPQPA